MASEDFEERVAGFVAQVLDAMGLSVDVAIEDQPDHLRINVEGEEGEWLLRRKGEGLDALQHVINTVFRHDVDEDRRIVVDCLDFRKAKDRELRQMARYLIERVRATGTPQEIGPLNSYARRLVHLEVSGAEDVVSASHGEGSVKLVVISPRGPAGA